MVFVRLLCVMVFASRRRLRMYVSHRSPRSVAPAFAHALITELRLTTSGSRPAFRILLRTSSAMCGLPALSTSWFQRVTFGLLLSEPDRAFVSHEAARSRS